MDPDAFRRWLSARRTATAEILCGLKSAAQASGRLDGADVLPGEPIRYGGYGEDRALYAQELFAPEGEEPRTVHLGLDIFAPAGADVFAPLDGRVHSFRDNARPGDYGPTIILEHSAEGETFYTLHGHLARTSLAGLSQGAVFAAGERLGRLGDRKENGGWPPHLHFQIILDIGEACGDYPGVCRRSERERWLALCPDPRPLLDLPPAA